MRIEPEVGPWYLGAVAEALMRTHGRSKHEAFEIAEAISPVYRAEGISPDVAALLWIEYTKRANTFTEEAPDPTRPGAQRQQEPTGERRVEQVVSRLDIGEDPG